MVNAPALTTATACNNALIGVGATIAEGNHLCAGIIATLLTPSKNSNNKIVQFVSETLPANMPPGVNSNVPVAVHVQIIAGKNSTNEVPKSIAR